MIRRVSNYQKLYGSLLYRGVYEQTAIHGRFQSTAVTCSTSDKVNNLIGSIINEVKEAEKEYPRRQAVRDFMNGKNVQKLTGLLNTSSIENNHLIKNAMSIERNCLLMVVVYCWSKSINIRIWLINYLSELLLNDQLEDVQWILSKLFRCGLAESEKRYYSLSTVKFQSLYHLQYLDYVVLLIRMAQRQGRPVLATSLCIKFKDKTDIPHSDILTCINNLLIPDPDFSIYNLKALHQLLISYNYDIALPPRLLSSVIKTGLRLCRTHDAPNLANDCYDLATKCARKFVTTKIPIQTVYKIMMFNLARGNFRKVHSIWLDYKDYYQADEFMNHDKTLLTKLILAFSKERVFRYTAQEIALKIPQEYYSSEGMTEALLIFCGRTKNTVLAQKVYASISYPLRRSMFTALLYMHIELKDSNGVERILSEINNRSDVILPHELGLVVKFFAKNNIDKAKELASRFPNKISIRINEVFADYYAEIGDVENMNHYLNLIDKHQPNISTSANNILLKSILRTENLSQARKVWQKWLLEDTNFDHRQKLIALNTILDELIRRTADEDIDNDEFYSFTSWLINEMVYAGVGFDQIRQTFRTRDLFRQLDKPLKTRWFRLLYRIQKMY